MRYLAVLLPLLLCSHVFAGQYAKDDFGYGYTLQVDGDAAVYKIALPQDIYIGSVQAALQDIRVFNGAGKTVPHEIRFAELQDEQQTEEMGIPIFPLFSNRGRVGDDLSLVIKRNASGGIISIRSGQLGVSGREAVSYLLDMEKSPPSPLTLFFEWQSSEGFMLPVQLQSSDNLVSWQKIGATTLVDLNFKGNRLRHGEVTLKSQKGKYLRLLPADGSTGVKITSVKAVSSSFSSMEKRQWLTLPLEHKVENNTVYLEAEIPGDFPIDRLQLKFTEPNSILLVGVQSRTTSSSVWRNLGQKLFYSLHQNGVELRNEQHVIPRSGSRKYRFKVIQDGAGIEESLPGLLLGYLPHELIFIARGEVPFVLAFGNGSMAEEKSKYTNPILQNIKDGDGKSLIHQATVIERQMLGGEAALLVKFVRPWKKIILWLVLIGGVMVLGLMVLSLRRKMDREQ